MPTLAKSLKTGLLIVANGPSEGMTLEEVKAEKSNHAVMQSLIYRDLVRTKFVDGEIRYVISPKGLATIPDLAR